MPILTVEAIRQNPWNVVRFDLPKKPDQLLLDAAHHAAEYCRSSEYALMEAALEGHYVPDGWQPLADGRDAHEACEARSAKASEKIEAIASLYRKRFGGTPG